MPSTSGLEEIFEEISPIEDFGSSMSLSFSNHRFEPPKYTADECKEKDFTYAAPLFVTAEFVNYNTGEIKSQTVFMGDFPLMTERGTFIINGTERVVVSQLVRSPGVYFERAADKTSDKDIFSAKIIPSRGAWLEFEIDKRDAVGVRVDRKRKQSVTVLLKALGLTESEIREQFADFPSVLDTLEKDHVHTQDEALVDLYRKIRPGEPPTVEAGRALLENFYFNPKRYDLAKVGRYKANKKLGIDAPLTDSTLSVSDVVATIKYLAALHADHASIPGTRNGEAVEVRVETDDIDHFGNRRIRAVGELHPEPGPHGPVPDGARRARAHDDAGRRGDHAADAHQHPPGRGVHPRVLRHVAALAVHGPEQPARGPDAQASSLGPRPGWSVARPRRHGGP